MDICGVTRRTYLENGLTNSGETPRSLASISPLTLLLLLRTHNTKSNNNESTLWTIVVKFDNKFFHI